MSRCTPLAAVHLCIMLQPLQMATSLYYVRCLDASRFVQHLDPPTFPQITHAIVATSTPTLHPAHLVLNNASNGITLFLPTHTNTFSALGCVMHAPPPPTPACKHEGCSLHSGGHQKPSQDTRHCTSPRLVEPQSTATASAAIN